MKRIGWVKATSGDKNKPKKGLGSFLTTLLNIKDTARLSALGKSSRRSHSVLININFHTLEEWVSTFTTRAKVVSGSEHRS